MTLLTYNVKHNYNLCDILDRALAVAKFGVKYKCNSSAQVSQFGLPSYISNQILRKYVGNKKLKSVSNIIAPVPKQAIKWDGETISIKCLAGTPKIDTPILIGDKQQFSFPFKKSYHPNVLNIHYIEFDNEYAHITCEVPDVPMYKPESYMGIDRNTKGHVVVAAILETGKTLKLGKKCQHEHKKYANLRSKAQKEAKHKRHHKYRKVAVLKHRESNIIRDTNRKIAKKVVDTAAHNKCAIFLESLKNMRYEKKKRNSKRNSKRHVAKSFRYSLNSWSYYQMLLFIKEKALLLGVPVYDTVPPEYTSQDCSICGERGIRNGKEFKCPHCGHADHADVNAAFNIARKGKDWYCNDRLAAESDVVKG